MHLPCEADKSSISLDPNPSDSGACEWLPFVSVGAAGTAVFAEFRDGWSDAKLDGGGDDPLRCRPVTPFPDPQDLANAPLV
jgi:hypothetical protein